MTVTRIWQAGAELQHVNELDEVIPNLPSDSIGSGLMSVSSTKSKTGTYSFTGTSSSRPRGKVFSSTTQIRAGFFLNHNGVQTGGTAVLLCVHSSVNIWVQWVQSTDMLELYVNTTMQDSIAGSTGSFNTNNTWRHCAITCKADTSVGFSSFYVDGVQLLTYSGNTGTGITAVNFHGNNNIIGSGWNASPYYDDFYVDDTVGEADAAPSSPRFSFLLPNGAGNYTNWNVNTGSNYAAVDDSGAPDDETTYVYATSSGVKDSYALTNTTAGVTVPAGYAIDAVIPIAWASKTDAGTASTLKVGTRLSSTDAVGSAQALATSFGPVWERQTTDPSAGAWSEADVDALEVYIESAGAY